MWLSMSKSKILSNLKWSKIFILFTNLFASVLFYFAYKLSLNIWFLIVAIVLVLALVASFIFFIKIEAKYREILNKENQ